MPKKNLQDAIATAKKPATPAEAIVAENTEAPKKENKSINKTFLLRPSVFHDAQILAKIKDTTVNDTVNLALEKIVNEPENRELIEKYRAAFEK